MKLPFFGYTAGKKLDNQVTSSVPPDEITEGYDNVILGHVTREDVRELRRVTASLAIHVNCLEGKHEIEISHCYDEVQSPNGNVLIGNHPDLKLVKNGKIKEHCKHCKKTLATYKKQEQQQ